MKINGVKINGDDSFTFAPFALENQAIAWYNSTEHRAQSTEHRAQSTEHRACIEVVLAIYDPKGTYSSYAGVVVTSLFSNTRGKVHVTLLHDSTLTDDNRLRFERTAERWQQHISFIDVSEHIVRIARNPDKVTSFLTRGALFRLLIPELLDVPKVIYLDCDVLVNLDIAELWNVPVETRDVSLAVVRDQNFAGVFRKGHKKIRDWVLRYDPADYFNSGVLVMNLPRIRKNHPSLLAEIFNFIDRYGFFIDIADQDILNTIFCKDVFCIDERFNLMLDCYNIDNAIIHMTDASPKPWKFPRICPRDCLFWKTFMESEWGDTLMSTLVGIYHEKPISSYHSIDCLKLLLSRLPKHLRVEYLPGDCLMVLKELWYRLTRFAAKRKP